MSSKNGDGENPRITDLLKKVINTGIGAAFMTEDTVRGLIQELPEKKEFLNGLLQNARSSKEDFIRGVKKEMRSYLEQYDVSHEIDRILKNYDIEVSGKLSFTPKNSKKASVKKKQSESEE